MEVTNESMITSKMDIPITHQDTILNVKEKIVELTRKGSWKFELTAMKLVDGLK